MSEPEDPFVHHPERYVPAAPVPVQHYQPRLVTDEKRNNGVELGFSLVLAILTLGYFLPWLVAATRGRSNSGAIALVNLFAGWTVIGWILALVMACQSHQVIGTGQPQQVLPAAPGWYPANGAMAYWDGARWTGHTA